MPLFLNRDPMLDLASCAHLQAFAFISDNGTDRGHRLLRTNRSPVLSCNTCADDREAGQLSAGRDCQFGSAYFALRLCCEASSICLHLFEDGLTQRARLHLTVESVVRRTAVDAYARSAGGRHGERLSNNRFIDDIAIHIHAYGKRDVGCSGFEFRVVVICAGIPSTQPGNNLKVNM